MRRLWAAAAASQFLLVALPAPARGPSEASDASALSVAIVVSGVAGSAGAVLALPVALSAEVATLVVRSVEATAHGIRCVLERVSDGARATVEISSRALGKASLAVGTALTATATASGVVLSAAGQAIAFIPNHVGNALLHNERLTQ